jgi:hypothetical protein
MIFVSIKGFVIFAAKFKKNVSWRGQMSPLFIPANGSEKGKGIGG